MGEFKLGLALAGGATMGAYSAGVLDFILEALIEFEKAKQSGSPDVPKWSVKIDNMTSTSAGSLCTYLTAASVCLPHQPMPHNFELDQPDATPPENNLLYRGWVLHLNAEGMFQTTDLEPRTDGTPNPVRAMLYADFLTYLGKTVVDNREAKCPVPSWFEGTRLQLTCSNTRGVQYSFKLDNALAKDDTWYRMLRCRDHTAFDTSAKTDSDASRTGAYSLNLEADTTTSRWRLFMHSAAASASVPGVFGSQVLEKKLDFYSSGTSSVHGINPDWPDFTPDPYKFNALDGGLFNNEPVGLSRRAMEERHHKPMVKHDHACWSAVVLIDCEANSGQLITPDIEVKPLTLSQNFQAMLSSLQRDSSFKESELKRDRDPSKDDVSEYVLSPLRPGATKEQGPIGSAHLSSFAGVLDVKIRHHDFMLGRRNAQQFLREVLTVKVEGAEKNDVFKGITKFAAGRSEVPILPLYGTAAKECPLPTWPKFSDSQREQITNELLERLRVRIQAVTNGLLQENGFMIPGAPWNLPRSLLLRAGQYGVSCFVQAVLNRARPEIERTLRLFPDS